MIQDTDNQQIVSDFILGYLGKTQSGFLRLLLSFFRLSFVLPFITTFNCTTSFPYFFSIFSSLFVYYLHCVVKPFFLNVILNIFPSSFLDFFVYMFPLVLFFSSGNMEMC